MLSLFPELLFLAPFAALLIRVAVAGILLAGAWHHFATPSVAIRGLAFVEAAAGVALIAGASTQLAALVGLASCIVSLVSSSNAAFSRSTIALTCVMCISLVLTGAGALAIDLPL